MLNDTQSLWSQLNLPASRFRLSNVQYAPEGILNTLACFGFEKISKCENDAIYFLLSTDINKEFVVDKK